MILGVAQVDEVLTITVEMTHALWVMKASLVESAINQTHLGTAYLSHALTCLFIYQDQAVISGVRYHQDVIIEALLFLDT